MNMFESVNVSIGEHSSIVLSMVIDKLPNVLFWYVFKTIIQVVRIPENALFPIVGSIVPLK